MLTAEDFLQDGPFVMYLGDNLLRDGITDLVEAFRESEPDALILLDPRSGPRALRRRRADGEEVVRLIEKPKDPPTDLALVGVYLFGPQIFDAAKAIEPSGRGELEITDAIQWLIDDGKAVASRTVTGWWKDTGQLDDMLEANRLVLEDIERSVEGELDRLAGRGPRDRSRRARSSSARSSAAPRSSAPAPASPTPTSAPTRRSTPG